MAATINNDGFIESDEIIVFPCANRGDGVNNAAYSQLLTEYNLTHTNGIIGNFDSYVITNVQTNDAVKFIAVIGGYLFSIPNSFNTDSYKYIGIIVSSGKDGRLQKISRSGSPISDSTVSGTNAALDIGGIFYGAMFLTETEKTNMTSNPFSYILDITEDTSAIARYNSANSQLILN